MFREAIDSSRDWELIVIFQDTTKHTIHVETAGGSYYLTGFGTLSKDPKVQPGVYMFDPINKDAANPNDMLVHLRTGEKLCQLIGEKATLLCTVEGTLSGNPETIFEPAAVLRAVHHAGDKDGVYELLGGFKNWSVDSASGGVELPVSVKDVFSEKVVKVVLEPKRVTEINIPRKKDDGKGEWPVQDPDMV